MLSSLVSAAPVFGGSAEPCEAIGACLRTQENTFNICILCQILTAPVGRVWRFTHFYSVAPLLEKWFACFLSSGDGLCPLFFSLCTHLASERHNKTKIPLPSFLSGGQNGNVNRSKEYKMTLSEESGNGYRQKCI